MDNIPLNCSICPKHPYFSDVSHMLTHVASKGHLSHFFKTQVRAAHDSSASDCLNTYNVWYSRYAIEDLLAQRMKTKFSNDRRKNNVRPKTTGQTANRRVSKSKHTMPMIASAAPMLNSAITDMIDPRLAAFGSNSTFPLKSTETLNEASEGLFSDTTLSEHFNHEKGDKLARRNGISSGTGGPPSQDQAHYSSRISDYQDHPNQVQGSKEESSRCSSTTALKGVYYPGMSLFDAASLQLQKKRNQRKDESVLKKFQQDAAAVECVEYIYYPGGRLKKIREISGHPESSPPPEESPIPKRSRASVTARSRGVLKEISANIRRSRRRGVCDARNKNNFVFEDVDPGNDALFKAIADLPSRYLASESIQAESQKSTYRDPFDTQKAQIEPQQALGAPPSRTSRPQRLPQYYNSSDLFMPSDDECDENHALRMFSPLRLPLSSVGQTAYRSDRPCRVAASPKSHAIDSSFLESDDRIFGPITPRNLPSDRSNNLDLDRTTPRYAHEDGRYSPLAFATLSPLIDFGGISDLSYHASMLNPLNTTDHYSTLHQP